MKILSVNQIQEVDKCTIANEPISSVDLMERAALACVEWIIKRFTSRHKILVFCGTGNNGGDGLVIARLLYKVNYRLEVIIINPNAKVSADFEVNFKRLPKEIVYKTIHDESEIPQIIVQKNTIIIDALFGLGISRPVEGIHAAVIRKINKLECIKISVDVPSGLFCDKLNHKNDTVLKANYTLSFQFPKCSFMFPENEKHVGEFFILDIGIQSKCVDNVVTPFHYIDKDLIQTFYKKRNLFAHKGNYGKALLIVGSYGKVGAAVLSAKACMKSGAGLLTVKAPICGYTILQTAVPEAMVEVDESETLQTKLPDLDLYNSIGIGSGIGLEKETQLVVKALIKKTKVPVVFDADAINCISLNKDWLEQLPHGSILTPHVKEFDRLVGDSTTSTERLEKQIAFSKKHNVIIVLKGHHTSISDINGGVYFNSTGNSGMATAGCGDVLTGIITALLAQGYSSLQSAIFGVYIHGSAGDYAAQKLSKESMTAMDIINNLTDAFQAFEI